MSDERPVIGLAVGGAVIAAFVLVILVAVFGMGLRRTAAGPPQPEPDEVPVVAQVRDFPPHTEGFLRLCDERGCGPVVSIVTDGQGNTDVAYRAEAVPEPRPAPTPAPESVARPVGPRPDVPLGRVLGGLLVAVLLGGAAVWLVRSTDWQAPPEAATPAMDAADLFG